jgi:hypothetical protein
MCSSNNNSNNSRSSSTFTISASLSRGLLFIYLSGMWGLGLGFPASCLRLTDEYVTALSFSNICNLSFSKPSIRHFMFSQEVTLDTVSVLLRM